MIKKDISPSWTLVTVKSIAQVIRGVSYDKREVGEMPGYGLLPVLRATNIQDNGLVLDQDLVYVPERFVSDDQRLRPGDIIVATSSGSKHLVGKTAQLKSEWNGSFGAFCAAVRPADEVNSRYLGYFFDSPAYKAHIAEARALDVTTETVIRRYGVAHRFSVDDLCEWHREWLKNIYEWAGQYRRVNLSKDNFPFAAANQIPALMARFNHDVLSHNTPCIFADRSAVLRALAETHVELVLIHPFRDGNGRLARVLSTLMALQAGLPILDFSLLADQEKPAYIAAIQAGLEKNYEPMERLFAEIIERSPATS